MFGTLSDIYGRRVMITVSLALFTVGSILCAVAPNMTVLIFARGLQGLGGGGIMPVVQTERVSPLPTPTACVAPTAAAKAGLEWLDLRAEHVPATVDDPGDRLGLLGRDLARRRTQVEEGHPHVHAAFRAVAVRNSSYDRK